MKTTFFSYRKGNSFFHRISAHIKLWLELLFCIFVFLPDKYFFAINDFFSLKFAICFLVCIASFFLSGRNLAVFAPLGYILILGILAGFGNGIKFAITYSLKFLFTAFFSQIVFMTTSSLQMKSALEDTQNFIAKIFPPIKKINPALIIFLAISFIPQIFQTWEKIKLAARARSCGKNKYRNFLRNTFLQFEALFSCLLFYAETKRKVLLNRSSIDERIFSKQKLEVKLDGAK